MRERKGRAARISGLADGVAAAVRRRQQGREPRVVLFGPDRRPRVLAPEAESHPELVDVAERIIDLVAAEIPGPISPPADEPEPEVDLPPLMVEDALLLPGPGFEETDDTGRKPRRRRREG